MAMITCRECGDSISEEPPSCTNCHIDYPELPGDFAKRMAAECLGRGRPTGKFTHAGQTVEGWDMNVVLTERRDGDTGHYLNWWETYFVRRQRVLTPDGRYLSLEKHWYEGTEHRREPNGEGDITIKVTNASLDHNGRNELRDLVRR